MTDYYEEDVRETPKFKLLIDITNLSPVGMTEAIDLFEETFQGYDYTIEVEDDDGITE